MLVSAPSGSSATRLGSGASGCDEASEPTSPARSGVNGAKSSEIPRSITGGPLDAAPSSYRQRELRSEEKFDPNDLVHLLAMPRPGLTELGQPEMLRDVPRSR